VVCMRNMYQQLFGLGLIYLFKYKKKENIFIKENSWWT
jgi:hypothetical protein